MKIIITFFLTLVFLCNIPGQELTENKTLRVMSYNVRCAACEDSGSINHWSKRKYKVFQIIDKYNPDILGLQEAEIGQINDIVSRFEDYKWVGKGREDGKEAGEFTAVLYKRDRFSLEDTHTYWLSETPSVPSRGWDAAYRRTVTVALLEDLNTESSLCFINTHFDNIGETARIESAKMLRKTVSEYSRDYPVIVTGDFNCTEDSKAYKVLTANEPEIENLYPEIENSPLLDSQYMSNLPHTGGQKTFNAFGETTDDESPIDFIFVNEQVKVISHQFITWLPEGLYPSDHFPVLVEIVVK